MACKADCNIQNICRTSVNEMLYSAEYDPCVGSRMTGLKAREGFNGKFKKLLQKKGVALDASHSHFPPFAGGKLCNKAELVF